MAWSRHGRRGRGRVADLAGPWRHRRGRSRACLAHLPLAADHLPARAVRLRQEHADPDHRRLGARDQRPRAHRRAAARRPRAAARRAFRHGMAEPQPVSLAQRHRQHRLRPGDAGHGQGRPLRASACADRLGWLARLRAAPAWPAVRRHAPARRARARADHGAADPADGRAVRRARRADQDRHAGGAAAYLRRDPQDHSLRHPRDRGGDPARRRGRGDDRAPRPHQGRHCGRPAAPALARDGQFQGVRRAVRPHLPPHPRGGDQEHAAANGDGSAMKDERVGWAWQMILPALTIIAVVVAWEAFVRLRGIAPIYLPAPSSVADYLWRMIADGSMPYHLGITLLRIFVGFALAAVFGVALGVVVGMSRTVARVADVWIAALYPLPKISLIPLLIIWVGTGEAYKIVISAVSAFFPIVISTYAGIRQTDGGLIKAAKDLGANARQIQLKVVIPAAIPSIFAGLHLGMGVAIILVVAAEMIGGSSQGGMGWLLISSGQVMETEKVFASLVVLAVVGALVIKLQQWIDRKVAPWVDHG